MPAGVTKDEVVISPEAQAEENIRSSGMAALPSSFLSGWLFALHAKAHPTTHHRGPECAPWRAFQSQLRVCSRFHANAAYHFDTARSRLFISLQICGFFLIKCLLRM